MIYKDGSFKQRYCKKILKQCTEKWIKDLKNSKLEKDWEIKDVRNLFRLYKKTKEKKEKKTQHN